MTKNVIKKIFFIAIILISKQSFNSQQPKHYSVYQYNGAGFVKIGKHPAISDTLQENGLIMGIIAKPLAQRLFHHKVVYVKGTQKDVLNLLRASQKRAYDTWENENNGLRDDDLV